MLLDLHYVLAVVCVLSRDCYRQVLLQGCQLAVEAVCDLLERILDFIHPDFVLHALLAPLFQLRRARIQRVLHLADDIGFHRLLPFSKLVHNFLVGSFDHLPQHFDILLSFFGHLFGVAFELILKQFCLLLAFLVPNILLTLHMA